MTASARIRLLAVLAGLVLPLSLQAQARPETHTVNRGDTLWDLARTYLGDPLLWPEIYRINTDVVEDPHWIYPGEVLRLAAGADVSAVPTTDTPLPADPNESAVAVHAPDSLRAADDAAPDEAAPDEAVANPQPGALDVGNRVDNRDNIDLSPLVGRKVSRNDEPSLELSLARNYRPIRRSEFYSSGFLTENQQIPMGTLLGTVTPLQIEADNTRNSAQLFTRVAIKPPVGGAYQVGDTLLLVRVLPAFQNYG
ncbi:MAG TPA: LysM peptidoglycan-binding domain-containing protein, partial [Gemmatimonadales bacterium]|nr:LysM peptidoglycan-binding domain-containing protein [Gemmatimonadales bacterium]